jgi:hypothetical protein
MKEPNVGTPPRERGKAKRIEMVQGKRRHLTDNWLSVVLWPLRPLGGMAREDRAARVAKGRRGAAIDVFRAGESPFSADHLRLVRSNDFKDD